MQILSKRSIWYQRENKMLISGGETGIILIMSAVFLSLFGIGEILRGFNACSQEATRKFVHFSGGIASLSFAYVFKSHLSVLLLCICFVTFMTITKKLKLLQSIHGIKRKSSGDILHPAAIYISFIIASYYETPDFYLIAIMVLSVSDALAALIGTSYGFKIYNVEDEQKSIEGSLIFFVSTFLIVHLGLLLLTHIGRLESVLCAILIAILVTCFEAISLGGADNAIIPFGTLFIIMKITRQPLPEIILQLCSVGIIFLITFTFGKISGRLGQSGVIGISLSGYAAYSLVGPTWYVPIFFCTLLISTFDMFLEMPGSKEELFRVRPIFYMFIVSFGWVLAANFQLLSPEMFFVPYVVSFAAILSIRWKWYQREGNLASLSKRKITPAWLANGNFFFRAAFLSIIFLSLNHFISPELNIWFSIASCFCGIITSDIVYWGIGNNYHGQWTKLGFLRMGMLSVIVGSLTTFLMGYAFYI